MQGVATPHIKQYQQNDINSLLETISKSQSKVANIFLNSKPNSENLQILSKGLGKNPWKPFMKKNQRQNLIGLSL
jgi:hypothetical protein